MHPDLWTTGKDLVMPRHFGVLIPSTNTTVEIEYNRLLPPDYQVHVGRLKSSGGTPFAPSIDAEVDYQAKLLGTAKVEVVGLAQPSASLFSDDYDADVVRRMSAAAGAPALRTRSSAARSLSLRNSRQADQARGFHQNRERATRASRCVAPSARRT